MISLTDILTNFHMIIIYKQLPQDSLVVCDGMDGRNMSSLPPINYDLLEAQLDSLPAAPRHVPQIIVPKWKLWVIAWRQGRKQREALKLGRDFSATITLQARRHISPVRGWFSSIDTQDPRETEMLIKYLQRFFGPIGLNINKVSISCRGTTCGDYGNYDTLDVNVQLS